jgi:transposase
VEHLTERQQAKISACLDAGDPAKGREIAIKVIDSFSTCPIPEVARLGRALCAWRAQLLAYFDIHGVITAAPTPSADHRKVRRLAHGFKDFDHYRLRIMLAADGRRPYRTRPNHT